MFIFIFKVPIRQNKRVALYKPPSSVTYYYISLTFSYQSNPHMALTG